VLADNEESVEHFCVHGWMRVRAAFSVEDAAAMRAAAWRALAKVGIRRSDPSTWTKERPEHLQHLKEDPAFRAVGSARLLEAIDAALEGHAYQKAEELGRSFPRLSVKPCVECAFSWLACRRELLERAFPARRCQDARVVLSSFKVIPIFVTYTPKAIQMNARPVSSTALKSMTASHCKSSRIQARRAT
jgi:hypothetical protein